MNPSHPIAPDDPRLTAYALGELDGADAAQVAAAVDADPELRAVVEEIRATAGRLTEAFEVEPMPEPVRPLHFEGYHPVRPSRFFRLPYWSVAAMAMAACVAFVLILRRLPQPAAETAAPVATLAKATRRGKATGTTATGAAAQQPHNLFEIQFPKKEEVAAAAKTSGLPPETLEHLGVVVPNPPSATASRSGAQAPAVTATAAPAASIVAKKALTKPVLGTLAGTRIGRPVAGLQTNPSRDAMETRRRIRPPAAQLSTERYEYAGDGGFRSPVENPLSTFSVNVDTAGYNNVRRFLRAGRLPPPDAVRIEELLNYFVYAYAPPSPSDPNPVAASLEVASAPWAPGHRLVRIGLKARERAEQANGTLATVAKDVKVRVEFNPARVQAYRLIGCSNRRLHKEAFNNDQVDAGDMRAGQMVTALYEVIPVGVPWKPESTVDALKYRHPEAGSQTSEDRSRKSEDRGQRTDGGKTGDEMLTVKVRYKVPEGDVSKRLEFPLVDHGESFAHASTDFKFAAAVAGFGMVLRDSRYKGDATIEKVERWAAQGMGSDAGGTRGKFLSMVKEAAKLLPDQG